MHVNQKGDTKSGLTVYGISVLVNAPHACICTCGCVCGGGGLLSHYWLESLHVNCKQKWQPTFVNSESVNASHFLCGGDESIWYMTWDFWELRQWEGAQPPILIGPWGTSLKGECQNKGHTSQTKLCFTVKRHNKRKEKVTRDDEWWLKDKIQIFITLLSISCKSDLREQHAAADVGYLQEGEESVAVLCWLGLRFLSDKRQITASKSSECFEFSLWDTTQHRQTTQWRLGEVKFDTFVWLTSPQCMTCIPNRSHVQ